MPDSVFPHHHFMPGHRFFDKQERRFGHFVSYNAVEAHPAVVAVRYIGDIKDTHADVRSLEPRPDLNLNVMKPEDRVRTLSEGVGFRRGTFLGPGIREEVSVRWDDEPGVTYGVLPHLLELLPPDEDNETAATATIDVEAIER